MKKAIYFICYILAFCVGILLLILNHHASSTDNTLLHNIFTGIGVVFVIPGLSILIANLKPKKDIENRKSSGAILSGITGVVALIWGILILIMPSGMFGNLNITLGVSIIIISIAQIIWIAKGKSLNGAPLWLYIIPILTAVAGVAILMIRKDYQTPGKELETGCILSGIILLFWSANGFLSLPRRKKTEADIEADEKKLKKDKEDLEKEKSADKDAETLEKHTETVSHEEKGETSEIVSGKSTSSSSENK